MKDREIIITNYVTAYNNFDVDGMVADFDENIVFENMVNDEVTMELNGIEEFRNQAEQAVDLFSSRQQTINKFIHNENWSEIEIEYYAVLAMDLPNGLKKGDELDMVGKSVFEFSENKIVRLTDIS
ncbi:nuclear transport factor 2 family protein [Dyadobacter chenwenxiniae]|uniref:Nuclear transport factor 2 family protein n=1 Tax=Dyadobacter chenwenxiniae TaxID=2906456 RepID=A0A9X1TME4_9BACT|nr:nuclear transport factor 2 family protein [Dyadobacter chenwenxiniae]MCF0051857.1 nuclear transport factor 2 family protein [Dyadobacter chenwenxiniae]MCF0063388.1 nuclear transport factor 2 family protein [Dyadobacter chenwenxiniae]UON85233.1 nuclear transport factor 2 family protein [Dyadobacter chenwenxiniae]